MPPSDQTVDQLPLQERDAIVPLQNAHRVQAVIITPCHTNGPNDRLSGGALTPVMPTQVGIHDFAVASKQVVDGGPSPAMTRGKALMGQSFGRLVSGGAGARDSGPEYRLRWFASLTRSGAWAARSGDAVIVHASTA